jgi:maltooligosyltrehalose trehalohydrolase
MDRAGDGWFTLTAGASHADDYGYRLDSGKVLPDPASRWQPDGVHGLSRLVEPGRFTWSADERDWRAPPLSAAVMYELHVGTFTDEGAFDAAIDHLAGLRELGVTHVEVMPVNAFNGEHGWGYDGVAWWAVHHPYGGPEGFARFVDACHRAGLAVLLDVVYNHLGPSGNYLPDFGPYLTDHYETPWGEALNLDGPDSGPVRAFIVGNALTWLRDYHVDGLRLDAVHDLVDTSAVHIIAELSAAVDALEAELGRPLVLVAESDRCDPLMVVPRERGGLGMDAQWADDLHHAIHVALTGERDGYYMDYSGLADVPVIYRQGWLFDGRWSAYRRRTVGAPLPDDVPGHRLVTCVQNHDQVGNRAAGERLTTIVEPALLRVGIVLLCAAPHTPLLWTGEEYGETNPFCYFTSHPEPELAEAVVEGRREEFAAFSSFAGADVPDPQDRSTLSRSKLDWSRADTPEGRARQALWTDLLHLRRTHPALHNGRRDLVEGLHADDRFLALVRHDPAAPPVLLVVNLGDEPPATPADPTGWTVLLHTGEPHYGGAGQQVALEAVPPRSASLWSR